jgi:pilus assembly protein CpaB
MKKINLNRSWIVGLGAVLFGGIAAFAVSRYVNQTISAERERLRPNEATVQVVVAKEDLKRGAVASSATMAVRSVPKAYVTSSSIPAERFNSIEGAKTLTDLRKGEMVLRSGLEGADATTFATRVSQGFRAITVSVDDSNAIGGLLQPGDRVDMFWTGRGLETQAIPGQRKPDQTQLFMQDLLVLATGKQIKPQAIDALAQSQTSVRSFATITMSVSLEDAKKLIVAQKSGTLSAVLRNPDDKSLAQIEPLPKAVAALPPMVDMSRLGGRAFLGRPEDVTELYVGGRGGSGNKQLVPTGSRGRSEYDEPSEGVERKPRSGRDDPQAPNDASMATQIEMLKQIFSGLKSGGDAGVLGGARP